MISKDKVNVVMKENELLREEIKLLHSLLQGALPVFTKITEEVDVDESSLKLEGTANEESLT